MNHLVHDARERGTSHPEWIGVGAQIGRLVNEYAVRGDLVGYASPIAGGSAPACYKPELAEVEVNTTIAFGAGVRPEHIGDLTDRDTQYEFPRAIGAIMHEAFHARFSRWSLPKAFEALTEEEYTALSLLEEGRIEAFGAALDSRNRSFLRSCVFDIVLGDISGALFTAKIDDLVQLVGLIQSRVIGNILDADEVSVVLDIIKSEIGEDAFNRLSDIMVAFQQHDAHHNLEPVYPLAREWVKIIHELKEQRGEEGEGEGGSEAGGTSGEKGEKSLAKILKEAVEALEEIADELSTSIADELSDQQETEEWRDEVNTRAKSAKEQKVHKEISTDVFGRGTGPMEVTATRSRLAHTRKPTSAERAAAVSVARMLEKAKYRERDLTQITSAVPGGRLRTKALVQGAALKAKGIRADVEPWRKNVRKQTDEPTLTVGVMVDISGSMSPAMEPMATSAWVLSEATKRVQGKAAMVYYGQDVFATLKKGQHLTDVNVYTAPDGTEKFDKAFKALDGEANLLYGSGARLLVVVSDGCYGGSEMKNAKNWISRCDQSGVAVVWLTFERIDYYVRDIVKGTSAEMVFVSEDTSAAALAIGKAAAKALTSVGKRNE